jgi:hypothetical protein
MANTNAPFGFVPVRRFDGAAWNDQLTTAIVDKDNSTPIFKGDVVDQLSTGYIAKGTAGTGVHLGIFWGCVYNNSVTGYPQYSPYWPGSGASADVSALIITDPNVVFQAQATTGPITFADIGAGVQFTAGSGNTATGLSTASVDNVGTAGTTTLPFRVIGLKSGVGPGTDATSAYNIVEVVFNNQFFKQLAGV